MWKSLRIGALLALAAVGALALAQYAAARRQMERIADGLAPAVRLAYSGVSGSIAGRVVLESPRLEIMTGPAKGTVLRAMRASIESPGTFWLLRRALTGDAGVPTGLDVHLEGASLAADALDRYAAEGWFGPASLVPFESIGCDPVTVFSARDYARMGVSTYPRDDDLRYNYDASAHVLRADVVSTAAPFATITAHVELSSFDPSAWFGDARASKAQRIEQFSLAYLDGGYLARRNRFCAQLTGTDAAGYAARHLAAVKAFLLARGVAPGEEVAGLYRKLVSDGGSAEISSLPEPAFVAADFASYAPDDLLRQLNVTVRRDTAPPILMRLAFSAPVPASPIDSGDTAAVDATPPDAARTAAADGGAADATATEPIATEPIATDTIATEPIATEITMVPSRDETTAANQTETPAVVAPEPVKSAGIPLLSVANAAVIPESPAMQGPRIALPEPPSEVIAVAMPETTTPWTTATHPLVDSRDAAEAIPASAPPPPPDSTAALVWRAPTIERLPARVASASDYVSVGTAALNAHLGARVRLLTAGGQRIEGRLERLDGNDVVVRVVRDGGTAQMRIPQSGIRDAAVRRSGSH